MRLAWNLNGDYSKFIFGILAQLTRRVLEFEIEQVELDVFRSDSLISQRLLFVLSR
jgi:hypothetical protein